MVEFRNLKIKMDRGSSGWQVDAFNALIIIVLNNPDRLLATDYSSTVVTCTGWLRASAF